MECARDLVNVLYHSILDLMLCMSTFAYMQSDVGRLFATIFDGTTRGGEAFSICARMVTEDFEIVQRLLAVETIAKSMTSMEMAFVLTSVLTKYAFDGELRLYIN
jgi:hypothetical protein